MGGCASKPKDLNTVDPAPVEAPAVVDKPEPETVEHEKNGGENQKEEPLLDLSEPAVEVPTDESKPAGQPAEGKVEEPQAEAATTTPTIDAETTTTVADEAQSDAPLVTVRHRLKPPSTAISGGQGAVVGVFMTTLINAFSPSGLFPTPLLSQGFTSGNKPDHFHRSLCNDTSFPPVSLLIYHRLLPLLNEAGGREGGLLIQEGGRPGVLLSWSENHFYFATASP
ncbi:hypothetical protein Nepgr_010927 [Nepenthes gracilis]|uniref:Uncharacterized protein n=1 Tax=Nepenthes gracilis TaxID=150966 RepID=A0AAD3XLH7_NEPGR|nr:hypothetical protein Nepgr_010927 [Nepenthes gracilis]